MKKPLTVILILCIMLSLCPAASADDWKLPEGTPMFEPGCVMETEFGTFTVLDAGFAKKVEMFYTVNLQTKTTNGESDAKESFNEFYYNAKDGFALFAVKGVLRNTSDSAIKVNDLHPVIRSGNVEELMLDAFAAVPLAGTIAPPPGVEVELSSGESVNIDFACTVPNVLYYGSADIQLEFNGANVGFNKAALMSYDSIGFGELDGVLVEDVTALANGGITGSKQEKKEAEEPHIDELAIEAVALKYDSAHQQYRMNVKIRNINYPSFEGRNIEAVRISFKFLDKEGDAVPANRSDMYNKEFAGLQKGQAGWGPYVLTEGSGTFFPIDRAAVDTAYAITFDSYQFTSTPDADMRHNNIMGKFSNPPVFLIDDIFPNRPDSQVVSGSDAIAVENVTVEFTDTLPSSMKENTAYRAGMKKIDYSIKSSETYAAIHFMITNLTKQDFFIADMHGDFAIELNFNNGFIYSTESNAVHFVQCEKEFAVISHSGSSSTRVGDQIPLSPLVSADVTLYLPCAKLVETMTDKPLVVSFHTTQTGNKQIDVKVR